MYLSSRMVMSLKLSSWWFGLIQPYSFEILPILTLFKVGLGLKYCDLQLKLHSEEN